MASDPSRSAAALRRDRTGVPETLRLATYNVSGRLWGGPRHARRLVERVLDELDADVLALQEVHPPAALPAQWVAPGGVEYHAAYGPTLTTARGDFGNAILSRYPIEAVRRIDLSLPGREPRGALDVVVDVAGLALRVIGTHLGLRTGERAEQARRLLSRCAALELGLAALMGDVNEWRAQGPALREIELRLGWSPAIPSFPSRRPLFALDRVWTHPQWALVSAGAHVSKHTRRASDHLPVVATVATGRTGGLTNDRGPGAA